MTTTATTSDLHNVVEFADIPRPRAERPTRVPAGTVIHLCFDSGRRGPMHRDREQVTFIHPDMDRLRAWVLRVTLGGCRLTPRELRWVHRVLVPVIEIGEATSQDAHVRSVQAAGFDLPKRRVSFGESSGALQAWIKARVRAAWAFEGQKGPAPSWLAVVCECVAQEALCPQAVSALTPPDSFREWEIWAKIRRLRCHAIPPVLRG